MALAGGSGLEEFRKLPRSFRPSRRSGHFGGLGCCGRASPSVAMQVYSSPHYIHPQSSRSHIEAKPGEGARGEMGDIAPGHPLTVPSRLNIWITEESHLNKVGGQLATDFVLGSEC